MQFHTDNMNRETIRISCLDPSPAASMDRAQDSKVMEEEHWRHVLTATVLTEGEEKEGVVLSGSVLHLYQQLLNKQVTGSADNRFAG